LACALGAFGGCSRKDAEAQEDTTQSLQDFTMTQATSGRKAWTLRAPKAQLLSDGASLLSRPHIEMYRGGRIASTAEGDEAIVREGSQDFLLRGDVRIYSPQEKATLKTDRLQYVSQTARFKTDSDVVIEQPGSVMKGRGLDADSTLSEIRIHHMESRLK